MRRWIQMSIHCAGSAANACMLKTPGCVQVIDLWTMTKNILRGGAQVVHGEMRLGKSFAILAQAMLGRFFSIPTIVVECHVKAAVTELVRNLNRGVTDPEYLVRAEAMDNRRLDQLLLLAESRKAVCTGRLVTVFHRTHTSLDQATRLRRTLDLTGVHLIYDEGNTLMTTSGTSKVRSPTLPVACKHDARMIRMRQLRGNDAGEWLKLGFTFAPQGD